MYSVLSFKYFIFHLHLLKCCSCQSVIFINDLYFLKQFGVKNNTLKGVKYLNFVCLLIRNALS